MRLKKAHLDNLTPLFDLDNFEPLVSTQVVQPAVLKVPALVKAVAVEQTEPVWRKAGYRNFYAPTDAAESGSLLAHNLDALTVLHKVRAGSEISEEERILLSLYSGWGFDPKPLAPVLAPGAKPTKIMQLMTEAERNQSKAMSLYAFFTPTRLARWMWSVLDKMGFEGGTVLEPALGNGAFFGALPAKYINKVQLCGVEPDALSVEIAQTLYPDSMIIKSTLEDAKLPVEFDLAIGNIPFGDVPVYDPRYHSVVTRSIHNYCIARSIDAVRPGGLVALITSRFTLDQKKSDFREYLAECADLVWACRLPERAFKPATEAIADILFLRRKGGTQPAPVLDPAIWLETVEQELTFLTNTSSYYYGSKAKIDINPLFVRDRHYAYRKDVGMMGATFARSGQFGATLAVEASEDEYAKNLALNLNERVPTWQWDEPLPEVVVNIQQFGDAGDDGAFVVKNGEVWRWESNALKKVPMSGDTLARTLALIDLSGKARAVLNANTGEDADLTQCQAELTAAYDAFFAKHGAINKIANRKLLSGDPNLPFLCSIEECDESTGKSSKTSIFTQRILVVDDNTTHCATVEEALVVSLNRKGRVDPNYMAALCEITPGAVVSRLKGLIYEVPQSASESSWQLREQALAGNVRERLALVEKLAKSEPARWNDFADALRAVIPAPLTRDEVTIPLGAAWIPIEYTQGFVNELQDPHSSVNKSVTGPKSGYYRAWNAMTVKYAPAMGMYSLENITNFKTGDLPERVWGTRRMGGIEVLEHALNNKAPYLTKDVGNGSRKFDEVATVAAKEKVDAIKTAWMQWLDRPEQAKALAELVKIYNEQFNSYVRALPIEYDPPLAAAGIRADHPKLRAYQRRAIWTMIQGGNLLLWHGVGAGKTMTLVISSMVLKRTGLRHKPMHVVPNHLVEQYATDFYRLFPAAKLLIISSDTTNSKNRSEMLARIATGNWDAVIVSHSAFAMIPISSRTWESYVNTRVQILEDFKHSLTSEDRRTIKQVEKEIARLKTGMRELRAEVKPGMLCFEELGVDMVLYDESHALKNLGILTQMKLPGLIGKESAIARDAFIKFQWLTRRCHKCGEPLGEKVTCCGAVPPTHGQICLSTGTAVSNSVVELYNVQRYLHYGELLKRGIGAFDAWASVFGEAVTFLEMKPSGTGWRMNTRFAKFHNVPDLLAMLATNADAEFDLQAAGVILPALHGGEPEAIECPSCPELEVVMEDCAARAEALKNNPQNGDNILAIMDTALKAALDLRLIDDELDDWDGSKISVACKRIAEIYHESTGVLLPGLQKPHNLAQVVFLDRGVPGGANFNLYAAMRNKLVALGLPKHEIAFVHDAKNDADRLALFKKVNAGIIRVLIGSTAKMGTGANMQRLLVALHHIDVPWTPADVEQREGRIIRSGNLCPTVHICRYTTRKSLDFYKWHLLSVKAHFIAQVVKAGGERKCDDLENQALTFDQMKAIATGDPLILEQVALEGEYRNLSMLHMAWDEEQRRLSGERVRLPGAIQRLEWQIANHETYLKSLASDPVVNGKIFKLATLAEKQDERQRLGKELQAWYELAGTGLVVRPVTWGNLELRVNSIKLLRWYDGDEQIQESAILSRPGDTANRFLELPGLIHGALLNHKHRIATYRDRLADMENAPQVAAFAHQDRMHEVSHRLAEIDKHFRSQAEEDKKDGKPGSSVPSAGGSLLGAALGIADKVMGAIVSAH